MRPVEQRYTRLLRSGWVALLIICLSLATAFSPWTEGESWLVPVNHGILFPSPSQWSFMTPGLSRWLAVGLNVAMGALMIWMNRRFNLLRTMSVLFVGLFMLMECATPTALTHFTSGQCAAIVVTGCVFGMLSAYNAPGLTRRIFLVFCVVAACSLFQWGFPVYLAVMMIGCAQMRIFSWRSVAAALLGVVTPVWIVLGLSLATPGDIHLPQLVNPYEGVAPQRVIQLFSAVAFTLLAATVTGIANLIHVLGKNARTRAFNGLLSLTGIVTGAMAVLDFTNIEFYIPLLNALTAMQTGYFFRTFAARRAYIAVTILLLGYIALWIWKISI